MRVLPVLIAFAILAAPAAAQRPASPGDSGGGKEPSLPVPKEDSSVTEHTIKIGGAVIPYRAWAGTMLLKDDKGEPQGSLYYTAYIRTDVKDPARRPITFAYNGGPGSSSAWLHMGAFGPRRVVTSDTASTPPPYRLEDNPNSLIDVTDVVFIDPIGTGFSKVVGKGKGKDFWGVDEDAKSLADFIVRYVSRNHRWLSPKYLLGESYGTTRSAVLVNRLQDREGMDFNGVVLISSVLDFETLRFATGHDISYALYLPSYAATAAYHHAIPQPPDLDAFLARVRTFAMGPYLDALNQGSSLTADQTSAVVKQLAAYTGLSEEYLRKANLRVSLGQFMEELTRSDSTITGRLDSRFKGPTTDLLAEYASYDPQSTAVTGAFTAAVNSYLRDELKYTTEDRYNVIGGVDWNWERGGRGWAGATYVGSDLVNAMVSNPGLHVQIENGYYDMATPFLATEYTVDHLDMPARLRRNISLRYYEAGHMMYLLDPALTKLKNNIAEFIGATDNVK